MASYKRRRNTKTKHGSTENQRHRAPQNDSCTSRPSSFPASTTFWSVTSHSCRSNDRGVVDIFGLVEAPLALLHSFGTIQNAIRPPDNRSYNSRLVGLVFGGEDYAHAAGITRTPSMLELLHARQTLVATAKAFNLQAIDLVYLTQPD